MIDAPLGVIYDEKWEQRVLVVETTFVAKDNTEIHYSQTVGPKCLRPIHPYHRSYTVDLCPSVDCRQTSRIYSNVI